MTRPGHGVRLAQLLRPVRLYSRPLSAQAVIQEHDVVLFREQGAKRPKYRLSAPLQAGKRVKASYGRSVAADDVIGRRPLLGVRDSGGRPVVVHEASLASYIIHSSGSRLATPIYPHDASTIVSLLDLHPARPGEDDDDDAAAAAAADDAAPASDDAAAPAAAPPPLELLEAGTGMGSLTLHLARAIHAANPPFPPALRRAVCAAGATRDPAAAGPDLSADDRAALDAYAASRRVVLHSIEVSASRAKAAYKLVRDFRRAQYVPDIDFHVGSVSDYLSARLALSGGRPFLSRAVLDIASAPDSAGPVVQALHPSGLLVLFQPSISQVAEFETWSRETRQPLRLEKVLELPVTTVTDGVNDAGGGRQWTVKTTVPKAHRGDAAKAVQVMRPKVGDRIVGGGFVAVFRRWPADETMPELGADAVEDADEAEREARPQAPVDREATQATEAEPDADEEARQAATAAEVVAEGEAAEAKEAATTDEAAPEGEAAEAKEAATANEAVPEGEAAEAKEAATTDEAAPEGEASEAKEATTTTTEDEAPSSKS